MIEILIKVLAALAGLGMIIGTYMFAVKNSSASVKTMRIIKICIASFAVLGVACLVAVYCLFGWEGFLA